MHAMPCMHVHLQGHVPKLITQRIFMFYPQSDIVYWGVHLGCWNNQLHTAHGKLNATTLLQMLGTVQTGNLQVVVYDLGNDMIYVSNAKGEGESGKGNAFDRQSLGLNTKALFQVPKPTV